MFETAISSNNDNIIADAMSAWIVGDGRIKTPGSYVDYLSKRMRENTPFSPRLRQQSIRVIERDRAREERVMVELGAGPLLNRLDVGMDEIEDKGRWVVLLRHVVRLLKNPEDLSPHYWHLLDKLVSGGFFGEPFVSEEVKVLEFLTEKKEWEKLELWVVIGWQTLPEPNRYRSTSSAAKDVEKATRELLLQRPSALPRLEHLRKTRGADEWAYKDALQAVCDEAKANHPSP